MSINVPEGSEPRVISPSFIPVRNQTQHSSQGSDPSEGQDSDTTEDGIIAPVHVGNVQRWTFVRSPVPSEGQDSDATDDGVIAPVAIGHLRRFAFLRSPALSEGHDSDVNEEGVIAPVVIGNQQRLHLPSPSYIGSEGQFSGTIEEGSAQINLDLDLRAARTSLSSDIAGNSSRPSVIFIRENSSNLLQAGQNANSSETSPITQQNVGLDVVQENESSGDIGPQESAPVQLEAASSSEILEPVHNPVVVHTSTGSAAGPSNLSVSHAAQDDVIVPVLINYPDALVSADTVGLTSRTSHSPSQNVDRTSGDTLADPASDAEIFPFDRPPTEPNTVGIVSTRAPVDQEGGSSGDGAPPSKKQRLNSPPITKKEALANDSEEDDGSTCTICLDQWTSSGVHRLVSLKCGHMFGFSCIERWIKNQKAAEKKCPTCKTKTKMTDVRNLYGHRIQMVDTTELEELRGKTKELEREKAGLIKELGYMRNLNDELQVKHREALMEIQKLKSEKMVSQQRPKKVSNGPQIRYRAHLVQTLELSKTEGCRVLAFNEVRSIIAASLPSPTNLFKEYALKLIDAESFRPRQTMPSHSRMIRDVAFSNDGRLLLSCSLDKTANVLCMDSNTSIATFQSEMPIWSACWDADNPWVLFTGAQNGVVQQFDVRSPGQEVSRIVTEGNPTPVASLAGIPKNSAVGWLQGGLLSCRFRQIYPYERTSSNTFDPHPCTIDGAFTSLRYERRTEHFLLSTRPTERSPRAQHMLFQMSALGKVPQYNLVQNFFGSTTLGVISRSCIMPILNTQGDVEDLLVSAYVENESHVGLWSCSRGQKLQMIQSSETVMDLCPIFANGKNYLSTLSDKRLRLYKVEKS